MRRKKTPYEKRLAEYYDQYEVDTLNPNDVVGVQNLIQCELQMEAIQKALANITDHKDDAGKIKQLTDSYKNLAQTFVNLQAELGISRKKRRAEDEESPLAYIERIQGLASKFMDSRLKKLVCPKCGQLLAKYFIYVPEKGEQGSLESKKTPVEPYKYTIRCECWKCHRDGQFVVTLPQD